MRVTCKRPPGRRGGADRRGDGVDFYLARVEQHRAEGQLARRRHMVSRLELEHRRLRGPRERVAPGAVAIAKDVQVGVESRDVRTGRHPGHEGPPRGHIAVEQDARLPVDCEQFLATPDHLAHLGEVGVGRAAGPASCTNGRVRPVVRQRGFVL